MKRMHTAVCGLRSATARGAFSLVEIVISLGIVSFALVALLGLFPIAMQSARASQTETRATFIARAIFNDLATLAPTNTFLAIGSELTNPSSRQTVNLRNGQTLFAAYDESGIPLASINQSAFNGGVAAPNTAFLARLSIQPITPTNGLSRVVVDVVHPAQASSGPLRATNTFVTLVRNE